MLRILYRYLVAAGLLANLALLAFLAHWAVNKVEGSDSYRALRRALAGPPDGIDVLPLPPVRSGAVNTALLSLTPGEWKKIHEQRPDDPRTFTRQAHAGAVFDPTRGRLMLFGSDTHGKDWDNSVRFFDLATLQWGRYGTAAPAGTYRVSGAGYPVAGSGPVQPWAMHSFDALSFDPASDRLIVASHPGHLDPKRFGNIAPSLWQAVRHHPTWAYRIGENRWEPLTAEGESFFPYGTAFDAAHRRILGVKASGYWSFSLDTLAWEKIGTGAPSAWHNSVALDTRRQLVVSFGTNRRDNDLWQYRPGEPAGRKMPTPGRRPPGAESAPLVYHPRIDRVVALIETASADHAEGITETWLYATASDSWTPVATASLPFRIGMNYTLVYDPKHDLLLLVASYPREPTAVWALKLAGPQGAPGRQNDASPY